MSPTAFPRPILTSNCVIVIRKRAQLSAPRIDQSQLEVDDVFLRDQADLKTLFLETQILVGAGFHLLAGLHAFVAASDIAQRFLDFQNHLINQFTLARFFLI